MKYLIMIVLLSVCLLSYAEDNSALFGTVQEKYVEEVGLIKVGEYIVHPAFGKGKVILIMPTEATTIINVEFEDGVKPLAVDFANIKLAE